MGNSRLILGSSSPFRQAVMNELGYEHEVMSPDIDERAIRHSDPRELVIAIATAKNDVIASQVSDAIVITADQVVYAGGEILEKPADPAEARRHWDLYRKYPSQMINGVVITDTRTGRRVSGVDIAEVLLDPIPDDVFDSLVRKGEIFHCAGSITLEDPEISPYLHWVSGAMDSAHGLPKELTQRLIQQVQA